MLEKLKRLAGSCLELLTKKETLFLFKVKERFRTKERTLVMRTASILGAAGFIWTVPAFFMLQSSKQRLNGLLVFAGMGFDVLCNNLFTKFFFHRIRPCVIYPQEYLKYSLPLGFSFPSGHALTSATGATIYTLISPLNSLWAVPVAAWICFARLYLFDHYPTDVLAGIVDGIVSGRFIYRSGHALYSSGRLRFFNALIEDDTLFDFRNYFSRDGRIKVLRSIENLL